MLKSFSWLLLFFSIIYWSADAGENQHSNFLANQPNKASLYHFTSIEHLIEQQIGGQVLPKIYQTINMNIKISPMPAKRAEALANSGLADGEIMRIWSYGNENPNSVRVPTPYYQLETMPFVTKSSGIIIRSKADLAQYRIVKVRGVKHTNNITENLPNVFDSNNTENMFKLLQRGKVDVVITNTLDGLIVLKKMAVTDIIPMEKPLKTLSLYHYIHKDKASIVPLVDNAIKQLKTTGELDKFIKQAEQQFLASF